MSVEVINANTFASELPDVPTSANSILSQLCLGPNHSSETDAPTTGENAILRSQLCLSAPNHRLSEPAAIGSSPMLSPAASASNDSDTGYSTPVGSFDDEDDEQHDGDVSQDDSAHSVEAAPPSPSTSDATKDGQSVKDVAVVDAELCVKIMKQVEWYFSDENLLKDSFLMKHINRNKQGYVSLKLVSSLRKVKALTKDWQTVLSSVRQSSLLQVNADETKIRRLAPAPTVDYSHVTRTVIITNYPEAEPTVIEIEKQFGHYGDLALVRILYPGRAIPLDVKPCKEQFPSLGKELCILVEYESEDGAKMACKKFNKQLSWRESVKMQLLSDGHKAAKELKKDNATEQTQVQVLAGVPDGKKKKKKSDHKSSQQTQHKHEQQPKRHNREKSPRLKQTGSSSSPIQYRESSRFPSNSQQVSTPYRKYTPPSIRTTTNTHSDIHRKYSVGAKCSGSEQTHGKTNTTTTYLHPDSWKDYGSDSGFSADSRSASESPKSSPEPTKRFFSNDVIPLWRMSTERRAAHSKDSCVIRQPTGPDGTRGFHQPRITVEAF